MKLFLSWSGQKSKDAAEAMKDWLPFVINAVEPWMSAADIEAGARWSAAIQSELEETRFGVVFVTRSNVVAPWLMFEAGALAKTIQDTYVCPYLIGLMASDLPSGPLTQFQANSANESGTWQLVQTINRALKDDSVPDDRLGKAFAKWWPDLESRLEKLPDDTPAKLSRRPTEEMIEEILTITRRLDQKDTVTSPVETQHREQELSQRSVSIASLTPREFEILQYVISGLLNKQIAARLGLSERTVVVHRARVMQKMGVESLAELVRLAIEIGIKPALE